MKLIELLNPSMFTDSYKLSHKEQVPPGTTLIYGHLTPRSNQRFLKNYSNHDGKLVVFGITYFLQTFKHNWDTSFFSRKWEELEVELIDLLGPFLGYSPESISHFKALHELGYLPLEIKALSEGSLVNMGVPYLTVKNTHPDFAWLSNYIEPYVLNTLSPTTTAATITREFAKLREEYYERTVSDHSGKDYHLHNFSYRGCHGHEMGSAIGMAHLLFTRGTDTLGAVQMARYYYKGEDVANSVPACYPEGTEVLTSNGFKLFEDLNTDDLIAQYNSDKTITFTENLEYHEYDYEDNLVNFKSPSSSVDLKVTRDHKMIGLTSRGYLNTGEAEEFTYNGDKSVIISGNGVGVYETLTPYERLLIAFQADGSFSSRCSQYTGERKGTIPIRFGFKKERKKDRLVEILTELGFNYSLNQSSDDFYSIRVEVPINLDLSKTFKWVDLTKISSAWSKEFIEELIHWDGSISREKYIHYSSIDKFNIDIVTAIASLGGFKVTNNVYYDRRVNRQPLYIVYCSKNTETLCGGVVTKELIPYKGKVRCVTVESGMIVVRQNGKVIICGNCEHSTATLGILSSSVDGNKLKGEEINLKRLLTEVYPSGIFSYITDSFDFWSCITVILPNLKDIIKARNGKLVIRHDSGNAVTNLIGYNIKEASTLEEFENIKSSLKQDEALKYNDLFYILKEGILEEISEAESKGIIEALYDIFGGSVNDKGFKELDPCIGAIYGDGISYSRLEQIYAGLEKKGFSVNNVVIALGAYTLSTLNDRDQFGQTIKGSVGIVNNSIIPIFKDPVTDPGKRSIQGFLKVIKEGETFKVLSDVSPLEEKEGELVPAFLNGDLVDIYKKTFKEIRDNLGFVTNS